MLRIAVLGCGRIGRMHADNIAAHPRAALAGVFDIYTPAAAQASAQHEVTNFASDDAVFAADDVDAVLIATSTPTHVEFIEKGVQSGKPILCEKPIDLALDKVEALEARIAGSAVPIMLGFVRRFDPGHSAVRKAIDAGEIGELQQVVITSRDPGMAPDAYIEVSGGIFHDMTIHDFDMARFILGEEVTQVFATGARLVDPALMERCDDYDTVSVVMTTGSGKQCIITNSRQATYGYDQRVEAHGSEGMVVSENRRPHMTTLHKRDFVNQGAPLLNFFIERYAEAFAAEISAFVDAVEAGETPVVGFEDGRLALVLAEAALESAKTGTAVNL